MLSEGEKAWRKVLYDDFWARWRAWLTDLGVPKKRQGGIIAMILKANKHDVTKTDWTFRRVRDSRTVTAQNVVAYLKTEIER